VGANNISGKMLKNWPKEKNTNINVQKQPPVEDTKNKIVQNRSQVASPRKKG
jgi:hypothetical protein